MIIFLLESVVGNEKLLFRINFLVLKFAQFIAPILDFLAPLTRYSYGPYRRISGQYYENYFRNFQSPGRESNPDPLG